MLKSRRVVALALAALTAGITLTGCSGQDTSALGQITPGSTVYVDLWNENGEAGDQAELEKKPSGMWVINTAANFRATRDGDFQVEITLDPRRGYVVKSLGTTKWGQDHDNCLSVNGDNEHYVFLDFAPPQSQYEGDPDNVDASNDDCVVPPEGSE